MKVFVSDQQDVNKIREMAKEHGHDPSSIKHRKHAASQMILVDTGDLTHEDMHGSEVNYLIQSESPWPGFKPWG